MPRLFNTVLLYLLMLAIPAQGYAASTMLSCGPAHQRMTTAGAGNHHAPHDPADVSFADRHGHASSNAFVDFVGHDASGDEATDLAAGDQGLEKAGDLGEFNCSACAACCMGAVFPASGQTLQPAGQAIERLGSRPFFDIGFVTDGPRRPPRSFPA